MSSMVTLLGLGLIGVYMVLAFQFRSYTLPVIVMLPIPFALIGTLLGHWALGLDLSMPSLIGFASLAGIVVNNAILFLAFFQTHLQGDDYVAASLNAVRDRFRPIVLSSPTTFVGLLPIIFDMFSLRKWIAAFTEHQPEPSEPRQGAVTLATPSDLSRP